MHRHLKLLLLSWHSWQRGLKGIGGQPKSVVHAPMGGLQDLAGCSQLAAACTYSFESWEHHCERK